MKDYEPFDYEPIDPAHPTGTAGYGRFRRAAAEQRELMDVDEAASFEPILHRQEKLIWQLVDRGFLLCEIVPVHRCHQVIRDGEGSVYHWRSRIVWEPTNAPITTTN